MIINNSIYLRRYQSPYKWIIRQSAADNDWTSICYGELGCVAVAKSGTGNRIMQAVNGTNWQIPSISLPDYDWVSVCYASYYRQYVAVDNQYSNSGNQIMFFGYNNPLTLSSTPIGHNWTSICYVTSSLGNGPLCVAVSQNGGCMVSRNLTDWELVETPFNNHLTSVCYGADKFVAVSRTGTGNRVMTMDW